MVKKAKEKVESKSEVGQEAEYKDLLKALKGRKFDQSVLLTLTKDAIRLVAAWPHVSRTTVEKNCKTLSVHKAWDYISFSMYEWSLKANVNETYAWERWKALAGMDIIYPDGTMPAEMQKYLAVMTSELMGD